MIELKVNLLTTKDPNKVREILKNLIGNEDFGVEVQCAVNSNFWGYGLVRIAGTKGNLQPVEIARIAIGIVRNLYKHEEIKLIEVFKMPDEDEDSECFIYNYTDAISLNNDNYIPILKIKKMKQINLTILLAMFMSMVGAKAFAHDVEVKNADGVTIYYNYINNSTELAVTYRGSSYDSYTEYTGNVVIPESVTILNKTRSVTSIGEEAFRDCSRLTSVTIPASVTSIGSYAFNYCWDLTSVTIPDGVTSIENNTFTYCFHLTSVTIPDGVTSIGNRAFASCKNLISVTIPASVTSIGNDAFRDCSGLTSVTIPASVTSIGNGVFYGCSRLTSVTIPASVTSIGSDAFRFCHGLTSITIPSNVTSIGDNAFYDCSGLTSITIPSSVTSIGSRAFGANSNLTEIVSLIQEPFSVSNDIVSNFIYNNGTLYVPHGTMEKYKATDGWKEFIWMEEGLPMGIQSPKDYSNITETQRYTIGGQSIKNSQRGLNIIKMSDGTTKKVMVK